MSKNPPSNTTPLIQNQKPDSLNRVKAQVTDVQQVMSQNMQAAMDRGESIDMLSERTDQLEYDSRNFKQRSSAVRRRFCIQYWRTILIIVLVVGSVLGLIIYLATRKKKNNNNNNNS